MKTILFFSFKGGVGRSLSLCNTAAALCRRGFRVGIVDFDVEAPSMHIHMKTALPASWSPDDLTPDILSLLLMDSELLSPQAVKEASILLHIPSSDRCCVLLPCFGRENDLEDLSLIWLEKIKTLEDIFEMFGRSFSLDFLLVDSRTGYSQQAILAAFAVNQVVAVSRADEVSISGMKRMMELFRSRPMEKINLVITGLPAGIKNDDKRVSSFVKELDKVGNELCIPYIPEWYFKGEVIWESNNHMKVISDIFDNIAARLLEE